MGGGAHANAGKRAPAPTGSSPMYIVRLVESADPTASAQSLNVQTEHTYRHAIKGFAAKLTDADRQRLQDDNRVISIELDQVVNAATAQTARFFNWPGL